jgi:lysozyme
MSDEITAELVADLRPDPLSPAVRIIKKYEGCRLTAYRDPVGIWTIGYGQTAGVHQGMVITQAEADADLLKEITQRANFVNKVVTAGINDNELCALISFCYNVGNGALQRSSLLRKLNADYPREEVAAEFLKWDRAGGKVLLGLTRRRRSERLLFLS